MNTARQVNLAPARPAALLNTPYHPCSIRERDGCLVLGNAFLTAVIRKTSGLLEMIGNTLTGELHRLSGDTAGLSFGTADDASVDWLAGEEMTAGRLEPGVIEFRSGIGKSVVRLIYELRPENFWLERHLEVGNPEQELIIENIIYGRCDIPGVPVKVLNLGRFDQPQLCGTGADGLFAGVGWWFQERTAAGVYQNSGMNYRAGHEFASAPWHIGVWRNEDAEPYPGWSWYRAFLEQRRADHDKQQTWAYWNAGWGQWGLDINDPALAEFIPLVARLGVKSILCGSGLRGASFATYAAWLRDEPVARANLEAMQRTGVALGFLDVGNLKDKWADSATMQPRQRDFGMLADAGLAALHLDFVSVADDFANHQALTHYLRTARERLAYIECHLGMAAYGPQLQREVLVNHPDDIHEFDIGHFSPDWATMLAFRRSRAAWQRRYDYLMPEANLYYFATHYGNWGHPKTYADPEPQQFLYKPHAYCGIGYNFHDCFGYREALMGALLFSPYVVFGYLDRDMPEADVAFTRALLEWGQLHAPLLRRTRVCHEDANSCVLSKLADGCGLVAVYNYALGRRRFRLHIPGRGGPGRSRIRRVYPEVAPTEVSPDGSFEADLPGESVALFEVGQALSSLPPTSPRMVAPDIEGWTRTDGGWAARVSLPAEIGSALEESRDSRLPQHLSSLDQVGLSATGIVDDLDDPKLKAAITRGRLPEPFMRVYGFAGDTVETWKLVPWAFADRAWLVYRPAAPPLMTAAPPVATVNGRRLEMMPRVDYRHGTPEQWTCPLFHADITAALRFGATNELRLDNVPDNAEPSCALRVGSGRAGRNLLNSVNCGNIASVAHELNSNKSKVTA